MKTQTAQDNFTGIIYSSAIYFLGKFAIGIALPSVSGLAGQYAMNVGMSQGMNGLKSLFNYQVETPIEEPPSTQEDLPSFKMLGIWALMWTLIGASIASTIWNMVYILWNLWDLRKSTQRDTPCLPPNGQMGAGSFVPSSDPGRSPGGSTPEREYRYRPEFNIQVQVNPVISSTNTNNNNPDSNRNSLLQKLNQQLRSDESKGKEEESTSRIHSRKRKDPSENTPEDGQQNKRQKTFHSYQIKKDTNIENNRYKHSDSSTTHLICEKEIGYNTILDVSYAQDLILFKAEAIRGELILPASVTSFECAKLGSYTTIDLSHCTALTSVKIGAIDDDPTPTATLILPKQYENFLTQTYPHTDKLTIMWVDTKGEVKVKGDIKGGIRGYPNAYTTSLNWDGEIARKATLNLIQAQALKDFRIKKLIGTIILPASLTRLDCGHISSATTLDLRRCINLTGVHITTVGKKFPKPATLLIAKGRSGFTHVYVNDKKFPDALDREVRKKLNFSVKYE